MGMAIGGTRDIDAVAPSDLAMLSKQMDVAPRLLHGVVEGFQSHAVPALRSEAEKLAALGFSAAPYIADDLESKLAPRMQVLRESF